MKARRGGVACRLYLVPIEAKKVLLLGAPVTGPGGVLPSAKYPSFDPLRLVLSAVAAIQPDALGEAASALSAGRCFGIYKVIATKDDLRRLGLSE